MQTVRFLIGSTILGVIAVLPAKESQAKCRSDPVLETWERDVAKRHFPALTGELPKIVACDADDFNKHVDGDFNQGIWRIRVKARDPDLAVTIAHELAHAQATKEGEKYGRFKGHGPIWMKVMIRAGFRDEAKRTASLSNYNPGLYQVYESVASRESGKRRHLVRGPGVEVDTLLKERPAFVEVLLKPIN